MLTWPEGPLEIVLVTVSSIQGRAEWGDRYGPWAVVTGASEGIGEAFARALARRGVNLVLVARRAERLEALGRVIEEKEGMKTRVVAADLAHPESVREVIEAVSGLDVGLLVACAGYGVSGPFVDSPVERELDMLAVNCAALAHLSHALGRRLVARGRGGIILLSSLVAFQGVPRAAGYAATKAYVQSLAEGLSHELRPLGVDVVASAPGPVASGFAARANMRLKNALSPEVVARETLATLGRRSVARPGLMTKFLLFSLAWLPRSLRVRALAAVMYGMTKHQLEARTA